MTTPPGPSDDTPPYGFSPPPPPPFYPAYQYPPAQPPRRISVPMVILGPFIYAALNLVIGFLGFLAAAAEGNSRHDASLVLAGTAVLLAVIAFGGGSLLLLSKSPTAKGLGIGLMVGWALVSLFSAGLCTGINPVVYNL